MARHFTFLVFSVILLSSNLVNSQRGIDRECGNTLETLWLDVVIVTENTLGMTGDGLNKVIASATTVFDQSTIGTVNYTDPRTTRVAIVSYNAQATINADLNTYQTTDDFIGGVYAALQPNKETKSFIATGLTAAEKVFEDGRANNYRANYKQLLILYASAYDDSGKMDPVPAATRLKESGITIATVAFSQQDNEASLQKIAELASGPNFAHNSTEVNLVGALQGNAIQVNCFCPDLWTQFRSNFKDEFSNKYGICVRPAEIQAAGTPARFACQNVIPHGYLATEFSQSKHDFNFQLVQSTPTILEPYFYFIGLTYTNGHWYWQQPAGESLIPLNESTSFWNKDFPIQPYTTYSAVLNQQAGNGDYGWVNTSPYKTAKNYICEVRSCDTDNYCADSQMEMNKN